MNDESRQNEGVYTLPEGRIAPRTIGQDCSSVPLYMLTLMTYLMFQDCCWLTAHSFINRSTIVDQIPCRLKTVGRVVKLELNTAFEPLPRGDMHWVKWEISAIRWWPS